jgi:hypothetical protein
MADDARDENTPPHIVPTAIRLEEPKFPNPISNSADGTQKTTLMPSATDGGAPKSDPPKDGHSQKASSIQDELKQSRISSEKNSLSHFNTDPGFNLDHEPLQKSATDSPLRSSSSLSELGRKRSASNRRPLQLTREATLTFDPYSSESSSSSDEDEAPAPLETGDKAKEEPAEGIKRTYTKADAGPFSRFKIANEQFKTKGRVSKSDGRLKLRINEKVNSGYFAKTLGAGLKKHLWGAPEDDDYEGEETEKIAPEDDIMEDPERRIKLNVVVIVIGSRGDIQPFLRIGKILKEDYGHRVRIATHPAFKKFVEEDSGLDFFSVGGDPSELMAFMVKNPGLIPSVDTIKEGEIGRRRAAMYEMFQGMWRACINATDDENDQENLKMSKCKAYDFDPCADHVPAVGDKHPFVADAIIANPPSFAPPHIAERLGIPLHMMFTYVSWYTSIADISMLMHPVSRTPYAEIDPTRPELSAKGKIVVVTGA